jgi:hypothetical protein
MATVPPPLTACPVCGTPIDAGGACPRCTPAENWREQLEAIDFAVRRLEAWHKEGRLTDRQWQALSDTYGRQRQAVTEAGQAGREVGPSASLPARDRCWSCKEPIADGTTHCESCGAPLTAPAVKSLRFYRFLARELDIFEQGGTITLRQAHEFVGEVKERIAALRNKLENDRAPVLEMMPVAGSVKVVPRRSFMEVLLDPHTIQWLLASGGVLFVLGLVIWMISMGLFENPRVVAAALGTGNAVILAGGGLLLVRTRYQLAGRALTLLACLVMPLNLWFYHDQKLVTLQGHLWVAAMVCCVIYAAAAWVLKDRVFVYVLVGGVTLTGLLLLGTNDVQRLKEILAPSALLVILGLCCLHAERAFAPGEGPFSRERFGMAFFWCAHALLGAGLLLLLGAQILGWLHAPLLRHFGVIQPVVATPEYLPWTLALALLGTYAYIYSDMVVRRIGVYMYLAAISIMWAEVQVLVQLDVPESQAVVIIAMALTALAVNSLQMFREKHDFLRTIVPLGAMLSLVPVLFGVLLHFRATNRILNDNWLVDGLTPFQIGWPLVGAMLVTALSCRAGAHLYRRRFPELSAFYFFATAAATLVFAAELTWKIGLRPWETEAPLLMLIPVAYLVASHLYRGHSAERPLLWCAHASTVVMLVCSLYVAAGVVPQVRAVVPIVEDTRNLLLAVFCLETALFYGLSAALRKEGWSIYLATAMLCGAIWQMLSYFHTPTETYPLAFSALGAALLVVYRLALLEQWEWPGLSRAGFQSANALTLLGFVAGALLSLSRLFLSDAELTQVNYAPIRPALYLMIFLTLVSLVAAWLVQQQAWRRTYVTLAVANGALTLLLIHKLSVLSPWQALELFSVLVGVLVLVLGHIGWYRESEEQSSELVSFAMLFGSLALLLPLAIAMAVHRLGYKYGWEISKIDEVGIIFSCVLLMGSGIICRIKATTLLGSITLAVYVLIVLIYLHRYLEEAWIIGMYLTVGGALLIATALVLSFFHDRLKALPDRIKRREGVFKVFGWR